MNNNMNSVATLTNRKITLQITGLPARLGRNNNVVDVYLFHESVSREHCLFECINRRFTVKDLGSTMGTYINGVRLEPNVPYNIEDGAKIQFGKVKMVFHANYEALARQERIQNPAKPAPEAGFNNNERISKTGKKRIQLSLREMSEYEYDESEVIYIDCGLTVEKKPLIYTSEIRKKEIETALAGASDNPVDQKIIEPTPDSTPEVAEEERELESLENEIAESGFDDDKRNTLVVEINEEDEEAVEDADQSDMDFIEEENTVSEEEPWQAEDKTLWLIWIDDMTGETKKLKINSFPFRIGRKSDENDYTIARKGISRKHMRFEEEKGEFYLYDEASTNGIKLNGLKIEPEKRVKLNSGDRIRIIGITFTVKID